MSHLNQMCCSAHPESGLVEDCQEGVVMCPECRLVIWYDASEWRKVLEKNATKNKVVLIVTIVNKLTQLQVSKIIVKEIAYCNSAFFSYFKSPSYNVSLKEIIGYRNSAKFN